MNGAQRVVLIIALGVATVVVATAANRMIGTPPMSGWFAYAPNSGITYQSDDYVIVTDDVAIARQALIWLLGVGTWTLLSMRLLRTRTPEDRADV